MRLFNKSMCYSGNDGERPYIDGCFVQELVGRYYYGELTPGYIRHHKDKNKANNTKDNIVTITMSEHAKIHSSESEYLMGLELGRQHMFNQDGYIRQQTIEKNSLLCKLYNQDQGIRRFKHAINLLTTNGLDITYDNYESLRRKVYNLPKVHRLISKGYGKSFEELVNLELPSLGELYSKNKKELIKMCKIVSENSTEALIKYNIFNKMDMIIDKFGYVDYTTYLDYNTKASDLSEEQFNYYYGMYINERPYIVDIWIEDVDNVPMYDFTEDINHNMIIPVWNGSGNNIPFICVHNSVYDAMKPMINWFESQMPLLANVSAFGSLQGDPAASQRYTETFINKFGVECAIGEMAESREVVDWHDNFDRSKPEPDYLSTKVPLLLINGCFSIAVGVKIEIPSHNINDVIDATVALLHNPKTKIALIPDPPMQCEIVDADWSEISSLGFGYYTVRGIIDTEKDANGIYTLRIKSVPELVFTNNIKAKIDSLIVDKKLIQIDRIEDKSTDDQCDIHIILKPGSDPEYVKQVLYNNTDIQKKQRVNMEVLIGLSVERCSYRAYLLSFLMTRREVKFRLYNHRLQKAETRLHKLDVYLKILSSDDVEGVIKMIRNQNSMDEDYVIEWLVKKLKITDLQAKSILHTEIRQLSKAHYKKYKEEYNQLLQQVDGYINIITHPELIDQEIENELLDIKAKYGSPRRSIIISKEALDNIPSGQFKIVITEANYVKKLQVNDPIKPFKGDDAKCVIIADNAKDLLLFDEQGRVFKLPVHKIAFTDRNSPGIDIRLLVPKCTSNIRTVMYAPIVEDLAKKSKKAKCFIVTVTTKGMIKRMDLDDIINATPSGIIYAKLNNGDSVKDVIITGASNDVVVYTKSKAIRLRMQDIPYLKRATVGNKALSSTDNIDGLSIVTPETTDIVVVTNKGYINRFSIAAMQPKQRAKAPDKVIKLTKGDSINAIFSCNPIRNGIRIITNEGIADVDINNIPIGSSISGGTKMFKTGIIKCELLYRQ